mmetsp:Transcript_24569/g.39434  ORF Transcript_24569/g.39434 Transcript_24569/m.39434 type:complete len:319 (+) Transcript_24569:162-1118(+)
MPGFCYSRRLLLLCLVIGAVYGADIVKNVGTKSAITEVKSDKDTIGAADGEPQKPIVAFQAAEKPTEKDQLKDDSIQPDEIKELFDRFDDDSNGYLNRKELFHYFVVTTPPDSEMGRAYKKKDYFNLVRYREFCKKVGADPLMGLTLENIQRAYSQHYGYAHKDWVVTAGMRSMKIPARERQHIKEAFAAFDLDNNGFINWPEMQKMVPSMTGQSYEQMSYALGADISEGIDLHGITKVYTRHTSPLRKAIKEWEKPKDEIIVVKEGNVMAFWILAVFFIVCLVAPITAWMCGVHKTIQGRKMIKQTAQQMQELVKAT